MSATVIESPTNHVSVGEVALHRVERPRSVRPEARQPLLVVGARQLRVADQEPRDRDRRLVLVLLEEHPLQRLRTRVAVVGHEAASFTRVPEDRARLGKRAAVVEDERRHAQRRVEPAEDVGSVRAVDHVHFAHL